MRGTIVEAEGRGSAAVAVMESPRHAVSWGSVIGGAFIITALSVILIAIGAGFGLSSVSPYPHEGVSLTTFTVVAAVWLIVVQWLSSAVGGYVAGRLSAFSARLHARESYFRDTVHGILAWAVAAVVTAALLASAITMLVGGAATGAASGASQNAASGGPSGYLVDTLYRSDKPDSNASATDIRGETSRIIATDIAAGGQFPAADRAYLAKLVAARTGMSQDEAQKRVDDTIAKAREAAEKTRKAGMQFALFTGFSMLIGAFIAAVAGKIGGNHREHLSAL